MTSAFEQRLITEAWTSLTSDWRRPQPEVDIAGTRDVVPSAFHVSEIATASIATALLAATDLHEARTGQLPTVGLDRQHAEAAMRSERYFEIDGVPAPMGFAPLSRFWPTADGWIRTHANYPWHRDALLRAVAATGDDPGTVGDSIRAHRVLALEQAVFDAGGVAAAVRHPSAWRTHLQGFEVSREPLIAYRRIGAGSRRQRAESELPATGVRVLDLTRVIAGPVCTRFLGALGADVLRIDPPHRPDLAAGEPADTLLAQRSAIVDAANPISRSTLDALLRAADVIVCGYRPGALDHLGLGAAQLADRYPGAVIMLLAAWGNEGPWANRRGFDSVVQAATGISFAERRDCEEPGALPYQLLDHATGYLAAAAVLDALRHQMCEGGTHIRRVSLARTAAWLQSAGLRKLSPCRTATADPVQPAEEYIQNLHDLHASVSAVRPPGTFEGQPLRWPKRLTRYANDVAAWTI
jgi:crotonobetainyl-CoA:carnitine CoA-transferase CaiB-like acyl-CoA transferase